eukprot:gene1593-1759_t
MSKKIDHVNNSFVEKLATLENKLKDVERSTNFMSGQYENHRKMVDTMLKKQLENENTEDVAIKVFSEIGVKIDRSEITACHRVPSRKGIPIIITKFINRKSANEILSNRRKLKGKTASDLGFEVESGDK